MKAKESGHDPYIALLEYRNMPLLDCNMSPAQLLYSRRTKSLVPITSELLQPKTVNQSTVQKSMKKSKAAQKANFDKSAKPLPPLNVNDSVRLQTGKFWRPAKVIKQHDSRSYTVQTRDGALYRRNRKHLMKTMENFTDFAFNPNVLISRSENSISPHEPPLSASNATSKPDRIPPDKLPNKADAPYFTRSGRQVMPTKCYAADEWITNKN